MNRGVLFFMSRADEVVMQLIELLELLEIWQDPQEQLLAIVSILVEFFRDLPLLRSLSLLVRAKIEVLLVGLHEILVESLLILDERVVRVLCFRPLLDELVPIAALAALKSPVLLRERHVDELEVVSLGSRLLSCALRMARPLVSRLQLGLVPGLRLRDLDFRVEQERVHQFAIGSFRAVVNCAAVRGSETCVATASLSHLRVQLSRCNLDHFTLDLKSQRPGC